MAIYSGHYLPSQDHLSQETRFRDRRNKQGSPDELDVLAQARLLGAQSVKHHSNIDRRHSALSVQQATNEQKQ